MSRKRFWVFPVIIAFIMTAFAGAVQASQPDEQGGWEFKTALYLWALSVEGDVTLKGRKSDVDVDFGDILDELNFAGMLAFSGRKGHWGFWGDVIMPTWAMQPTLVGLSGLIQIWTCSC